jgi:putative ABC transport system permease protein
MNSALIGYLAAQKHLGYVSMLRGEEKAGPASTIYMRAATGHVAAVQCCSRRPPTPRPPTR